MAINNILNGESAANVRDKLNQVIEGFNALTFTDEKYTNIVLNTNNNSYTVDYSESRNAVIDLVANTPAITYLNIINVPHNQEGKILIKQSGGKTLIPTSSIVQELVLPTQNNKITVINYQNVGGTIYLTQDSVITDVFYQGARAIDDLTINSFDGITLSLKWTEPYSDSPDNTNIDGYDIRYSHSPITNSTGWLNAVKLGVYPSILGGGIENTADIKLKAGNTYYIYFRTYKNYKNAYYLSPLSNVINVTTRTYLEPVIGEPKMLPLSKEKSYPKLNKYQVVDGIIQDTSFLYDKDYTPTSINDERPDTSVKILSTTAWEPQKYWEDALPYYIVFDLGSVCTLDSIYLFTKEKADLRVYAALSQYDEWVDLGSIDISFNDYGFVSLNSLEKKDFRYIKLSWEKHYYANANPELEGTACWSNSKEYQSELRRYNFFAVYGYPKSSKPNEIIEANRDYSVKHTIGDVMNTNGHFYQDGRIHSMVGGRYPRLFGAIGHFDAKNSEQVNRYDSISNFKYKTEELGWVAANSSNWDFTLRDLLEKTYKPYGLKPIITGTGHFDSVQRKTYVEDEFGNKTYTRLGSNTKFVDQHYFDKDNPPMPIKGVNGISELFEYTFNPENYKIYGKLAYTLAAKYGSVKLSPEAEANLPIETDGFPKEIKTSGLDLLSGFEYANEENRTWTGWEAYQQPEEGAAVLTTIYDGNMGKVLDGEGNQLKGAKDVDSDFLILNPGIVGIDKNYLYHQDREARRLRKDSSIPLDVYSVHIYSSTIGINQTDTGSSSRGLPWDMQPSLNDYAGEVARFRNRLSPTKQIWITEFGFGEAGGYNTGSKYAAYSLPGYIKDEYTIPDIHRSEVKAAWTIRSIIQGLSWGFNAFHYYSTENESNWFDEGQWGGGAGYEMWEWEKLTDDTPGAKITAIEPYMIPYTRSGFAAMGLFGGILVNGAYPVARGTWLYMTFRNRLKDFYFSGIKKIAGKDDLIIACFSHKTETKSAFVIYRVGVTNSCYTNIHVDIPEGASSVTKINYYIPQLPDPRTVPFSETFGLDQNRTGLPTSVREYDESGKVINATFPTEEENPYFPIVGAIGAKGVSAKFPGEAELGWKIIGANQYVKPNLEIGVSASLSYRQVDAICDYIDFHTEGKKGANGIEENILIIQNQITIDTVTEVPNIYIIDNAIIQADFESSVSDLSGVAKSSSAVMLYWNNNNPNDESYDLYLSEYPDGGYTFHSNILAGITNEYLLTGLVAGTTYYVKLQPKFKDKLGTLSEYTSIKTFDYVQTPENLTVEGISITSIKVSFNSVFQSTPSSQFLSYVIERKDIDGTTKSFIISNRTTPYLNDINLPTGRNYSYRVKVSTYGGDSDWTAYIIGRTKTPEEASPALLYAETDKIINVIRLTFDIDLSSVFSARVKNAFSLTENNNPRVLTNVALDVNNSKILILTYYPEAISSFDKDLQLLLSYSKPLDSLEQIKSSFGNGLNSFINFSVKNNYGNYNNLIHTYQVDFNKSGSTFVGEGWNSIIPSTSPIIFALKDKYGLNNNVILDIPKGSETINSVVYRWEFGSNTNTNGVYNSEKFVIPEEVYNTYGNAPYHATNERLYYSVIKIKGLNNNNRYTLNLFSSKPMTGTNASYLSFNVNGIESGLFNFVNNSDKFVTYTDLSPINNEINIKLHCESSDMGKSVPLNFFILEEFEDSSQPDDGTVFIKDVYILNKSN
ncbi:MAG: hypothetical protein ACK5MH_06455 [Bacteroidales bacterium]